MIRLAPGLEIAEDEIVYVASRSGGPGGQNVNKVSSKVTLLFDIERSKALTSDQRRRIREGLSTRINKDGVLRVISQRTRSQDLNRADALERLSSLLQGVLQRVEQRIPTRVPNAAREQRLHEKRKRTEVKRSRSTKSIHES